MSNSKYRQSRNDYYTPPLDRLDKFNNKYMSKNVRENDRIKNKYSRYTPSEHVYFFINRNTSDDILDNLIESTTFVKRYTIDTEDQARHGQPSLPALIQIQFVHAEHPPMILLMEMMHLPTENSSKFLKIKQLVGNILSASHVISCWGDPVKELEKFTRYNLFDNTNIHHITPKDVQRDFTIWFNELNPDLYRDKWSLQLAVEHLLRRWLDKRMTMANWGCGIDPSLETFTPTYAHGKKKETIIQGETEYRQLMVEYSILDCMSVTEIKALIPIKDTERLDQPEDVAEKEQMTFHEMEDVIYLHPIESSEIEPEVQGNLFQMENVEQQHRVLVRTEEGVYVTDERLSFKNVEFENEFPSDRMGNHVPNEQPPKIEEHDKTNSESSTGCQRRKQNNRKKNQKARQNRYRFEVIRRIFYKFNESDVKEILVHSNIRFTNVNIVGHTLFVGVKNEIIRQRLEQLLTEDMLTKEHYDRLWKRRNRKKTVRYNSNRR